MDDEILWRISAFLRVKYLTYLANSGQLILQVLDSTVLGIQYILKVAAETSEPGHISFYKILIFNNICFHTQKKTLDQFTCLKRLN